MRDQRKLKFCKACGAEIAKSCKKCPHCGVGYMGCFSFLVIFIVASAVAGYVISRIMMGV